ncbi:hypothetical protein FACS1894137_02380 [Spirochaetia bacterium]|nr:hypothetical protein FACS1894137_02380 [Spirochaetia bacterium]
MVQKVLIGIVTVITFVYAGCVAPVIPLEGAPVISPIGGHVFYDKGEYSDGWRYLEAAPKDAGEATWDKAFQLCDTFVYGGKDDWFLPSKDEMKKMLDVRIIVRGEKDFWSSTEYNRDDAWYANTLNFTDDLKTTRKVYHLHVLPIRRF